MIPQTPWITRKFNFDFPVGLFPVIITRLKGTPVRIEELVDQIPEQVLSEKPGGAWSVKEIIGHLGDLEALWSTRINDFLEKKETLQAADMDNTKTHQANHNEKTSGELIHRFRLARQNLLERVSEFDEAAASTTALHPRLKVPMRLIDSLYFAAEHDDHELTRIRLRLNR